MKVIQFGSKTSSAFSFIYSWRQFVIHRLFTTFLNEINTGNLYRPKCEQAFTEEPLIIQMQQVTLKKTAEKLWTSSVPIRKANRMNSF